MCARGNNNEKALYILINGTGWSMESLNISANKEGVIYYKTVRVGRQ